MHPFEGCGARELITSPSSFKPFFFEESLSFEFKTCSQKDRLRNNFGIGKGVSSSCSLKEKERVDCWDDFQSLNAYNKKYPWNFVSLVLKIFSNIVSLDIRYEYTSIPPQETNDRDYFQSPLKKKKEEEKLISPHCFVDVSRERRRNSCTTFHSPSPGR